MWKRLWRQISARFFECAAANGKRSVAAVFGGRFRHCPSLWRRERGKRRRQLENFCSARMDTAAVDERMYANARACLAPLATVVAIAQLELPTRFDLATRETTSCRENTATNFACKENNGSAQEPFKNQRPRRFLNLATSPAQCRSPGLWGQAPD